VLLVTVGAAQEHPLPVDAEARLVDGDAPDADAESFRVHHLLAGQDLAVEAVQAGSRGTP
jgi:hypothetical protein